MDSSGQMIRHASHDVHKDVISKLTVIWFDYNHKRGYLKGRKNGVKST